ncbi:MAG: glycosyltransferase [Dehalococcoidia bacterium]|nr:glycosyltransferase [Dehalococcoidia bacterium]
MPASPGPRGPELPEGATSQAGYRPIALPRCDSPRATIIIPVFNKSAYTHACLEAVSKNSNGVDYEVIVVDDASTDDSPEMLDQVLNARVIRKERNEGFVEACHAGAAGARGDALVFLNNDTLVRDGWLEQLLKPLELDDVGIVGAKLIASDGRLQEAGAIVFSDGTPFQYGRGGDPDAARFNFIRDVSYCSGACLAVRKTLWEKLGGFDRRYSPAYYEDADLAMAARKHGYRVIYQPRAEVVHHEGISHGTDLTRGVKRFQGRNHVTFREKWSRVLESDHPSPETPLDMARWSGRTRRALVVDNIVPTDDRDAGSLRRRYFLTLLSELGWAVSFLPDNLQASQPYTHRLQQDGIEVIHGPAGLSYISEVGPNLDLVVLARPEVADRHLPLVRRHAPQAEVWYDTIDLHYVREARQAEVTQSWELRQTAETTRQLELSIASRCDHSIVVTDADKATLQREIPGLRISVIPTIHEAQEDTAGYPDREHLLFVGHYQHPPNEDAAVVLAEHLFPSIRARLPGVKLYLVGNGPTERILQLSSDDIIVTGWVDDLSPFLRGCRVFVAPLRFGSGMKGKIAQSMSYGLPVVSTSIGAEGMRLEPGRHALIADPAADIVDAVVTLYEDPQLWATLSNNSMEHVRRHWSPSVLRRSLQAILPASNRYRHAEGVAAE